MKYRLIFAIIALQIAPSLHWRPVRHHYVAYTETDGDSPTERCSADVASSGLRAHLSYSGDLPLYIRARGTYVCAELEDKIPDKLSLSRRYVLQFVIVRDSHSFGA